MLSAYYQAFARHIPQRAYALHLPISVWVKRHQVAAGALAVIVFPVCLLGLLFLCTLALTLPIAFLMGRM